MNIAKFNNIHIKNTQKIINKMHNSTSETKMINHLKFLQKC